MNEDNDLTVEELNDFDGRISELISILHKVQKEHGDIYIRTDAGYNNVEFILSSSRPDNHGE